MAPPGVAASEQLTPAGIHELCCRATDSTGRSQLLEAAWNLGGYASNEVRRLRVVAKTAGAVQR